MPASLVSEMMEMGPERAFSVLSGRIERTFDEVSFLSHQKFGQNVIMRMDALLMDIMAINEAWDMLSQMSPSWKAHSKGLKETWQDVWNHVFDSREWKRKYVSWLSKHSKSKNIPKPVKEMAETMKETFSNEDVPERRVALEKELDALTEQYDANLAEAKKSFVLVKKEAGVKGLSKDARRSAKKLASEHGFMGWAFPMEDEAVNHVLMFAHEREVREMVYDVFSRRAWPNIEVARKILECRHELALMKKKSSHVARHMRYRMASSERKVRDFLGKVRSSSGKKVKASMSLLRKSTPHEFREWDEKFYLPASEDTMTVAIEVGFSAALEFAGEMFGMTFERVLRCKTWNRSVRKWRVKENGRVIGFLWVDPFARNDKTSGNCACWCVPSKGRRDVFVSYDFSGSWRNGTVDRDGLSILLHEIGHAVHFLKMKPSCGLDMGNSCDDIIEVPSVFMEAFAWKEEFLHRLPGGLEGTKSAKNSPAVLLKMSSDALFDLEVHGPGPKNDIIGAFRRTRASFDFMTCDNHMPNSFEFIFSMGYDTSYYSYLWSEAVAAQVFEESKNRPDGFVSDFFDRFFFGDAPSPKLFLKHYEAFVGASFSEVPLLKTMEV